MTTHHSNGSGHFPNQGNQGARPIRPRLAAGLACLLTVLGLLGVISLLGHARADADSRSQSKSAARPASPQGRPELKLGRTAEYDYTPPVPGTYALPAIKAAADGQVLDSQGNPRSLRELVQGQVTILSFIYLRCSSPKGCPASMGVLYQLHQVSQEDPVLASNLRLVTMSFDPVHDTPKRMAQYARGFRSGQGGADWLFLTTRSSAELKPILRDYGQVVDRKRDPNDPYGPYSHPVRVFLIDAAGQIRNIYSFSMLDPRLIMTDVRTLLSEQHAGLAQE